MLKKHKQPMEMFLRVQDFLSQNPVHSPVFDAQNAVLNAVIEKLLEFSSERPAGQRQSRAEVQRSRVLRRELRERHLAPISQIARAMLSEVPGVHAACRLPSENLGTSKLIAEAVAVRKSAAGYPDVFVTNGRPDNFLEQLDEATDRLRTTLTGKAQGVGRSVGAREATTILIRDGRKAIEILDVVMKDALVSNPDLLTKWILMKRVQRVPGSVSPMPATGGTADENLPPTQAAA